MKALESLEVEMPPLTIALYDMSVWFKENWKMLFVGAVVLVVLIMLWMRTEKGKYLWDAFKFKAPLVGKITKSLVTARFARAFGLLIDGGLDVIDAMETVNIVLGNKYAEKRFKSAIEDVRQGMSLTVALDSYGLVSASDHSDDFGGRTFGIACRSAYTVLYLFRQSGGKQRLLPLQQSFNL